MLGQLVRDPHCVESEHTSASGLGLLPLETELGATKRLTRTRGRVRSDVPGIWTALRGVEVEGYEIHVGHTRGHMPEALLDLDTGPDGSVTSDGLVAGTYVHGIFESAEPRQALVRALARARGFSTGPAFTPQTDPYAELADVLAETLRLDTTRVPALTGTIAVR